MPKLKPLYLDNVRYLTLEELREELGYHIRHMYLLLSQGKFKGFKRGACWYFHPNEVKRFIEQEQSFNNRGTKVDVSIADNV